MSVFSLYVEKKPPFSVEAGAVLADLRTALQAVEVTGLRLINRYLAEGLDADCFERAKNTVFSEPPADTACESLPDLKGYSVFASEYLPGQFDQRADSCAQCLSLAFGISRPEIRTAKIYALEGDISPAALEKIKAYLINPVESREASLDIPETLALSHTEPPDVSSLDGFTGLSDDALTGILSEMGLAMDLSDLKFCQEYFRAREGRDPTVTEIRVIDTYWSDHCRHTTFLTELESISADDSEIQASLERYFALRGELGRAEKPVTLMDMATIGARALKARGLLPGLDESEEINACSVKIKADEDGVKRDWLLMFKNETHNHPTEIEPFGGAATCLGGAIRDPLSGRSYVYQAMRVTGAGNPLEKAADTLAGKLPQRKICQTAAAGYSSYGNQIGLATGLVHEIYHPGYRAKRMEIGAVIGAAPAANVIRSVPAPGDAVILLGGRTGRDGIGGATGSSKSHDAQSLGNCGAEVQKGNPPEERKLQRLFRNPAASRLIKRCNDFGAGGVCVSIGELADGVRINLDKVPKKYDGLDGTELAISESQERMSVVISPGDTQKFITLAEGENLEAVVVGEITATPRLVMTWRGQTVVSLSRSFLSSNGAPKKTRARIAKPAPDDKCYPALDAESFTALVSGLGCCSQKGLAERFGSTIGRGTVLMPFGGKHQLTPAQVMAGKLPVPGRDTSTVSLMSWGFDPFVSEKSPYHGAVSAVIHSVAKIIAAGGSRKTCYLTFQEYFERLGNDPVRWGKPAAALLGALEAQLGLQTAAIGGKDSMSGSFEDLDVPPTLVSFAVSVADIKNILSPEFKRPGSYVYLLKPKTGLYDKPDFTALRALFDKVENLIAGGHILSAWAAGSGGAAEAVFKMCLGNRIGFESGIPLSAAPLTGGFILEADRPVDSLAGCLLGKTAENYMLTHNGARINLETLQKAWEQTLEPVYPCFIEQRGKAENFTFHSKIVENPAVKCHKPKFVIPVFPGTNCEYDTARAIEAAGGEAEIIVIRNRSVSDISLSARAVAAAAGTAQAIMIPGGFSGGDEPDGSGKFITAFFRNAAVSAAVANLLQKRDGLICGICNGFQALIKLGLVPYGEIRDMDVTAPTLTYNRIGRHQSMLARTRVASDKSPWLAGMNVGDVYLAAACHGEGRFAADETLIRSLAENGQIATQYADFDGNATQDIRFNPNNSDFAVEGITSPDGRVFGRMCHNERSGEGLFKNVPGNADMDIFKGAVAYYRI